MKYWTQDQMLFRLFLSVGGIALVSLFWECLGVPLGLMGFLLSFGVLWVVTGVICAAGFRNMPGGEISVIDTESQSSTERLLAVFLVALAFYHVCFFLYEAEGFWWMKNPNLNGDLPFHWHQIRYLARGPSFWPENPQYAGETLRYAFGVNWLSALGLRFGLPLGMVMVLPLLLILPLVAHQLWKWAGLWGVVAFFGSGGGWFIAVQTWPGLWGPGDQIAWKNLFLAILVTQRGFWFALPAGLLFLRFLLEMNRYPWLSEPARWRMLFALWACLPFFHLHTFVILTLFAAVLILVGPLRERLRKQGRSFFLQALMWSWLPLFFVLRSVNLTNAQNSLRWVWNWMSDTQPLVFSLAQNGGAWLILVILLVLAAAWGVAKPGRRLLAREDIPVVFTWFAGGILFSHLMLAPWSWDQSKILLWIYLGLSAVLGDVVNRKLRPPLRLMFTAFVFFPGLVQFWGGLPTHLPSYKIWSIQDQVAVQNLVSALPINKRVLVAPSPQHPVLATGQPLVAGYLGHLWSHGLDINGLEDELRREVVALPGDGPDRPLHRVKADYLIWGPLERSWFGVPEPTAVLPPPREGEPRWIKIRSSGDWSLYARAR